MKKLLLAGVGAAVLAGGVAIAQTPGGPPPGQPPAPPPPGGEMRPPGPPPGGMGGEMGWGRHMGGPPHMRGMMASKAAHFHFSRGPAEVDIRCAADEPMKACVEAASTLLDKLAAQPAR